MGPTTQTKEKGHEGLGALSGGWVKFENVMPDNPKVAELSDRAFRLWINAICYASRAQSDGDFTRKLAKSFGVFALGRALDELVTAGLLDVTPDGFHVHDYLKYQLSRARISELREEAAERTRRWRDKKGDASPNHHLVHDPFPSSCSEEEKEQNEQQQDFPRELCQRLADHIVRNDAKARPRPASEAWQRDMRLLLNDRTGDVAEVERVIDWCQTDAFWHSNILSPAKLRKQFTQLALKVQSSGKVVNLRRQGSNEAPRSEETTARIRARQKELAELEAAEQEATATGEGRE